MLLAPVANRKKRAKKKVLVIGPEDIKYQYAHIPDIAEEELADDEFYQLLANPPFKSREELDEWTEAVQNAWGRT